MRLVIQRAAAASVAVGGTTVGSIDRGLVVLCGIHRDDGAEAAEWAVRKICNTRLFESEDGKPWAQSVSQAKLGVLLVSQFTLLGQLKGNKPDFSKAMGGEQSRPYWESFVEKMRSTHNGPVQTGEFGAYMQVSLTNDGPVTLTLDHDPSPPPAAPPAPPPPKSRGAPKMSAGGVAAAAAAPGDIEWAYEMQRRVSGAS